ncbi:hypothetical protein [uncultured Helicobacter sp.]|uniref:hypothetical protein n=1 Tax=uncultured Helicobacter sp. TaxID=175537 RepID=UPI00374EDFF1
MQIAKGWEATTKQYPILESIARPNYIVQNQKGRVARAKEITLTIPLFFSHKILLFHCNLLVANSYRSWRVISTRSASRPYTESSARF